MATDDVVEVVTRRDLPASSSPGWVGPVVVAEVALSALLGALHLGRRSAWLDEAVTAHLAGLPAGDFVEQVTGREINSVLYFTLVRGWSQVAGDSEVALRSLSVVCVALTVVPLFLLGRELAGPVAGALAGLLWAVAPRAVVLGQEARGFALETLLLTVSAVVLLRAVRTGRDRDWAVWSALTVLAALAHALAVLVSIALLLSLAGMGRRAPWRPAALAMCAALLPLAVTAAVGRAAGAGGLSFLTSLPVRQVVGLPGALAYDSFALAALLCGAVLLAVRGAVVRVPQADAPQRVGLILPLSWLTVPVLLACVWSVAVQPVFTPRYFVTVLPAFVLAAALGLRRSGATASAVGGLALVAVSLVVTARVYDAPDTQEWRPAVARVLAGAEPGDVVVPVPSYDVYPYEYAVSQSRSPGAPPAVVRPESPVPTRDRALLGARRAWVLSTVPDRGDERSSVALDALAGARLVEERTYDGLVLQLWDLR